MAVAVFISNERGSTEVFIDNKSSKEIALVGRNYIGAVPVVIVGRAVPGAVAVKITNPKWIVSGETLTSSIFDYTNKVIAISPSNLIGYWPIAESSGTVITDESGNGRNGVYRASGEPLLGQPGIGDGRTAALFDGSNDYGNIYSASLAGAFNGAEGTATCWGRVSSPAVWTDATTRRLLSLRADANDRVLLEKSPTNNQVTGFYIAGGTSKSVVFTTAAPIISFHFAITWSKSDDQVKVYFSGVQVGSTQTGLGTWVGALDSANTTCGATDTTGGNSWKGYEAHVAVWRSALSAAQIATLAVVP